MKFKKYLEMSENYTMNQNLWDTAKAVMVFSVVMYGCESWTVKKAEH